MPRSSSPRASLAPGRAQTARAGRALSAVAACAIVALSAGAPAARAADDVLPAINLQLTPWTVIAQEKGFFKE